MSTVFKDRLRYLILLTAILCVGCMKTTVALEPVRGTVNVKHADTKKKAHFFLWGLVNRHEYDLDVQKYAPVGVCMSMEQSVFPWKTLGNLMMS